MNYLTSSVLRSLFADHYGKNWVFSPASYLEAMGSLAVCVSGKNLSELIAAAPDILEPQATGLDTYNCLLYSADYREVLVQSVVDALAARGGDLKTFVGAEVVNLVNDIVEEKTHGKIRDLLSPSDVDAFTKGIILNCVYFKRDWLHEFDQQDHYPRAFHGATTLSRVKYLNCQTAGQRYYEDETVDIVEVQYKESEVCCYLIVPKMSLFEVFNGIETTLEKVALVKANLDVDLTVPPFKVESTIDLGDPTRAAGVGSIFEHTKDWALFDWTRLDPAALTWVSLIKQKAYIDFTKEGTEAAAATAFLFEVSGCCLTSWTPPPIKRVLADKPFLYVLANCNDPSKPLFVGVVNDVPSSY